MDGDNDGDLVVFEPLSSQPIGVWINDGAGSFHEGRLADFRKLWSERTRVDLARCAFSGSPCSRFPKSGRSP